MTTITEDLDLPGGGDPPGRTRVVFQLAGEGGQRLSEAYHDGHTIVLEHEVKPAADGSYSIDLERNDEIVPAGTRWKRTVKAGSLLHDPGDSSVFLNVDEDGTFRVDEKLSAAPGAIIDPGVAQSVAEQLVDLIVAQSGEEIAEAYVDEAAVPLGIFMVDAATGDVALDDAAYADALDRAEANGGGRVQFRAGPTEYRLTGWEKIPATGRKVDVDHTIVHVPIGCTVKQEPKSLASEYGMFWLEADDVHLEIDGTVVGDQADHPWLWGVNIKNSVNGGTYKLTVDIAGDDQETAAIAWNAHLTPATVLAALEALSNIDPGDVQVVSLAGDDYGIVFDDSLVGEGISPSITVSNQSTTVGGVVQADGVSTDPQAQGYCIRVGSCDNWSVMNRGVVRESWGDLIMVANTPGSAVKPKNGRIHGGGAWLDGRRGGISVFSAEVCRVEEYWIDSIGVGSSERGVEWNTGPRVGIDVEPNATNDDVINLYVGPGFITNGMARAMNFAGHDPSEVTGLVVEGVQCFNNGQDPLSDTRSGVTLSHVTKFALSDLVIVGHALYGLEISGESEGTVSSVTSMLNGYGFRSNSGGIVWVDFNQCIARLNTNRGFDVANAKLVGCDSIGNNTVDHFAEIRAGGTVDLVGCTIDCALVAGAGSNYALRAEAGSTVNVDAYTYKKMVKGTAGLINDLSAGGLWLDVPPDSVSVPVFGHTAAVGTFGALALNSMAGVGQTAGAAQNNELTWPVKLRRGTYKIRVVHMKNATRPIYKGYIDGALLSTYGGTAGTGAATADTIDGYNASNAASQGEWLTVSLPADKVYQFRLLADTRNASNTTGWDWLIHAITFVRTGDPA